MGEYSFSQYEFYQYASQHVSIEECEELFDDLIDVGIIRRVNKLFEFHHHLFVEHIIEQNPDAVPSGMLFEFDRDDERLYGCVKAWCDDKSSKIALKHEQRVHEFYPRAKYDLAPEQEEEQEHKLLKFFSDDQTNAGIQLLSGSAGNRKINLLIEVYRPPIPLQDNRNRGHVTLQRSLGTSPESNLSLAEHKER